MALEAVLVKTPHQQIESVAFVYGFRENVFVGWVARGAVNEKEISFVVTSRKLTEEIPASVSLFGDRCVFFELFASPVDRF